MRKFAKEVQAAEVTGTLAAFVDSGLLKVGSEQEFDALVSGVCSQLGSKTDVGIRKIAKALQKTAVLGMLAGAFRASELSDEDRRALIDYYRLPLDASPVLRNAGRGLVGETLGRVLGSTAGVGITKTFDGARIGELAGGGVGAYLATNKYSKDSANRIREMMDRERWESSYEDY